MERREALGFMYWCPSNESLGRGSRTNRRANLHGLWGKRRIKRLRSVAVRTERARRWAGESATGKTET